MHSLCLHRATRYALTLQMGQRQRNFFLQWRLWKGTKVGITKSRWLILINTFLKCVCSLHIVASLSILVSLSFIFILHLLFYRKDDQNDWNDKSWWGGQFSEWPTWFRVTNCSDFIDIKTRRGQIIKLIVSSLFLFSVELSHLTILKSNISLWMRHLQRLNQTPVQRVKLCRVMLAAYISQINSHHDFVKL